MFFSRNRTCSHPATVLLLPSSQAIHVRLPSETVQFVRRREVLKRKAIVGHSRTTDDRMCVNLSFIHYSRIFIRHYHSLRPHQ